MKGITKKERVKMLIELDHLVRYDGDKNRIKELRDMIGGKETASREGFSKSKNNGSLKYDMELLKTQYTRMRALGMSLAEISFALGISSRTIYDMINNESIEVIDAIIDGYKEHKVVVNSEKQKKKRWKNL